jgi:phospholipid/cholesterol/gamma-HCH transport system permease protein
MIRYTGATDIATGFLKAFVFGGIIATTACYKGLYCKEGAEGVGRATTEAVVYGSITILIVNFFLTLFLNQVLELI